MSETSMLTSVEGLINTAMGPPEKNTINYKMLQTVLYLLARHMRMLETKVQIRISDDSYETKTHKDKEKIQKKYKDQKKYPEEKLKYHEGKKIEKAEKVAAKEKEKIDKMSPKEIEKYLEESDDSEMENITHKKKKENELQRTSPKQIEKDQDGNKLTKMDKSTSKEKEKYLKEQEEEEKLRNMTPEEIYEYFKEEEEREMEKMTPKEKETHLEEKEKEQKKLQKMSRTEKENYFKEKVEREIKKTRRRNTETRAQEGGNVEVVTRSDFRILEDVVMELKEKLRPLPKLALPDSKYLRSELAKGTASLADTMETMQISARVEAVEQAIDRMVGLLAQLKVAGALPEEFGKQLEEVKADMVALKSEQGTPSQKPLTVGSILHKQATMPAATPLYISHTVMSSHTTVTHEMIDTTLRILKEDLLRKIQFMVQQANMTTEMASIAAKAVAEKFDATMKLNDRIDALHSLTSDYAEQLTGFGAGLATQMQSFKEQIVQMKEEMQEGLTQLNTLSNNAGTPAVQELTERFEGLSADLEGTAAAHQDLAGFQRQLSDKLQSLTEAVEMLREQKADRDEMLDGLRDKADMLRLKGLVTTPRFESVRADLEMKLIACYGKFSKQETVWIKALQELAAVAEAKAELTQLLETKKNAKMELKSIQMKLEDLAVLLGGPKAGMLTRLLSKEGRCASCKIEALMDPQEAVNSQPIQLPAQHPSPEEPCVPQCIPIVSTNTKEHICQRWVGGSHTLVRSGAPRELAAPLAPGALLGRYTDYGSDGRTYKMAEELVPCDECNRNTSDIPEAYQADGGGDNKLPADIGEPIYSCIPAMSINK